jgi:hypothetical protein
VNARDVECDAIHVVPKTIPIYGSIYDLRTGRLNEVNRRTSRANWRRSARLTRQCTELCYGPCGRYPWSYSGPLRDVEPSSSSSEREEGGMVG